jgi:uncharacterized protein YndB with AHSA1/START domain
VNVERELDLPAPPAEVWPELTDPPRLGAWLGAEVDLDARRGGRGRFRLEDGEVREALVHEADEPHRLVFTWWPVERDGRRRMGAATTVTITVDEAGQGSRLTIVEAPAPGTGPRRLRSRAAA